jgi:hypothetical protein
MHGSTTAADLSPSYLASSDDFGCEMQPTSPSILILMCSDPSSLPPPCPLKQTTRILAIEEVATSQMHLCIGRMFREWFPEFDVRWLSNGVSIE